MPKMTNPVPTTVAKFISEAIAKCGKAQLQISAECGWNKPNIVTMIKQGKTRLPMDKVGLLAKSLGVDAVHLLRLTMGEYMPDTLGAVEDALQGGMLTAYERQLVESYRSSTMGHGHEVLICQLRHTTPVRCQVKPMRASERRRITAEIAASTNKLP